MDVPLYRGVGVRGSVRLTKRFDPNEVLNVCVRKTLQPLWQLIIERVMREHVFTSLSQIIETMSRSSTL